MLKLSYDTVRKKNAMSNKRGPRNPNSKRNQIIQKAKDEGRWQDDDPSFREIMRSAQKKLDESNIGNSFRMKGRGPIVRLSLY